MCQVLTTVERVGTKVGNVVLKCNLGQFATTVECRIRNHIGVNNDLFYCGVLEHVACNSGLRTELNFFKILTVGECTVAGTAQVGERYFRKSGARECVFTDCIYVGEVNAADIVAGKALVVLERVIRNYGNVIQVNVYKVLTICKCACANSGTGFGKCYVCKSGAIVECILCNGGNTLGDNYRRNGFVAERILLHIEVILAILILTGPCIVKVVMCKRVCANFVNTLVIGNNNLAAFALVSNKLAVFNNEFALYFNRATSRQERGLAVDGDLQRNSCITLANCCYNTVLINGCNSGVTGFPFKAVSIAVQGNVPRFQAIIEFNLLGRIERDAAVAVKVTEGTGFANFGGLDIVAECKQGIVRNKLQGFERNLERRIGIHHFFLGDGNGDCFVQRDFDVLIVNGYPLATRNANGCGTGLQSFDLAALDSNNAFIGGCPSKGSEIIALEICNVLGSVLTEEVLGKVNCFVHSECELLEFELEVLAVGLGERNEGYACVECVVVNVNGKTVGICGLCDEIDVVGDFKSNLGYFANVFLVNRDCKFFERSIGLNNLAHNVGVLVNNYGTERHCIMVIVNHDVCIVSVLFQSLIVLGSKGCVNNCGSLVVDCKGEGIRIQRISCAAIPVKLCGHGDLKLGVVSTKIFAGGVVVHGEDFTVFILKLRNVGIYSALVVSFIAVVLCLTPNNLAGCGIGNSDIQFLSTTQKTCVNTEDTVDGLLKIGDGCVLSGCGDCGVLALVDLVEEASERNNVVVIVRAYGHGSNVIGLDLIVFVNCVVVSLGFYFVVVKVKDGCIAPVAVESKERSVKVDAVCIGVVKGDKAFNVHTVFKSGIEVSLILIGKGKLYGNGSNLATCNGNDTVVVGYAITGCGILSRVGKHICHFCYEFGVGGRNALGHSKVTDGVAYGRVRKVLEVDGHCVNTGAVGVVTKLELGLAGAVCIQVEVCGSRSCFFNIGNTCALLSRRVRIANGVVCNGCSGHTELLNKVANLGCRKLGVIFLNVLTDQDSDTAHVGSRHTGTAEFFVSAAGNCRINVATVRGDFGLELKVGSGTPAGEITHKGTCFVGNVEYYRTGCGHCHNVTLILTDGDCRNFGIVTNGHTEFAKYVVVYDYGNCACLVSELDLFLEGDVATANKCYLALQVKACIVNCVTETGNGNVLKLNSGVALGYAQHFKEIEFLAVVVVSFFEEYFGVAVNKHVVLFVTVDRSNRESGTVCSGSTNDTGVGVVCLVGVALLTAVRTAVVVGSCNYKRNTCIGNSLIKLVLINLICLRLQTKAAGGTKAHVDSINAKLNGVFQSCDDIAVFCTAVLIAEYLHNSKLRIDSNAYDLIVVTADNAGNVSTVLVVERHNVGILIRIVITECNFAKGDVTVVNLSCLKLIVGVITVCHEFGKLSCDLISIPKRIDYLVSGECAVCIVTTGIENSHNGALTGVADIAGVKDTRIINVNRVFNCSCSLIGVGNGNSANAYCLAQLFDQFIGGAYVCTVKNCVILMLNVKNQSLLDE